MVYARCRRLLREAHAAEDAVQETFVRALRRLRCVSGPDEQRRWLLRVATNYCLNQLRDRKRHAELLLEVDSDTSSDAALALAARDVAARVTRNVPEDVRRVAWLMYVAEMQQDQVAKLLGISRRTVVNRLAAFRASAQRAMVRMNDLPNAPPPPTATAA